MKKLCLYLAEEVNVWALDIYFVLWYVYKPQYLGRDLSLQPLLYNGNSIQLMAEIIDGTIYLC